MEPTEVFLFVRCQQQAEDGLCGLLGGEACRREVDLGEAAVKGGAQMKAGFSLGTTDELGYHAVEDRVHVHDFQATILHLLGINHEKLTYRFQGRDFRLTDVDGKVVQKLLA